MQRFELLSILSIIAIAFALRAAAPSHMAVEHFDEGVYASNLYCGHLDPPYQYPDRPLYAPPLLPSLLEWVLLLNGGQIGSLMWVNVAAGALMVVAVWFVAREWFGAGAALAAAVLAATSEYHIAFSRMALTDVLLCLWMLLGVHAGWRAILSGRPFWIGLAGLLAGLAWCTKYNGWLTLAVTGSAAAAWVIVSRPAGVHWWKLAFRWSGTALIAGILFWVVAVQPLGSGGYAAVSANHAKYFVGLGGWWDGLLRHLAAHRFINGGVTYAGFLVAPLLFWFRAESPTPTEWNSLLTIAVVSAATAVLAAGMGATLLLLVLTAAWLAGTAGSLIRPDPAEQATAEAGASLAAWIVAAWFIGLLVAVPLYYPYPRLSLPLLVISWIGAGAASQWLLHHLAVRPSAAAPNAIAMIPSGDALHRDRRRVLSWTTAALMVAVPLAIGTGAPSVPGATAWENQGGIRDVAPAMLADVTASLRELPASGDPELDAVIYVYADPAAFFHLAADATEKYPRLLIHPAGNLGMTQPGTTRRPVAGVFLVTGPRAHRTPATLAAASERLELLETFPYEPGDIVLLDEFPAEVVRYGSVPAEEFRLWRIVDGN